MTSEMNKRKVLIGAYVSILLAYSSPPVAAEGEYYSDMKIVLTGDTVEGKLSKNGSNLTFVSQAVVILSLVIVDFHLSAEYFSNPYCKIFEGSLPRSKFERIGLP